MSKLERFYANINFREKLLKQALIETEQGNYTASDELIHESKVLYEINNEMRLSLSLCNKCNNMEWDENNICPQCNSETEVYEI